MSTPAHRRVSALARAAATWIGALALVLSIAVVPAHAAPAETSVAQPTEAQIAAAATLSGFDPGNIISDAVFFDKSSMTEAQIQSFLQSKVSSCQSGYTCLKDWYDTSRSTSADAMCGAYSGGTRERASRIIYKVAQACGINPQVILTTLQKEQGLVTHTAPSEWRYTIAMGQGCPDTAACDTRYYGFFNQVYGAAWQFKRYANPPGTSQYFTWYAPGKTWNILYHPNSACGRSPVYVRNQATSNLYYYTPYQPNAAALRAGYGEGDGCSSYGNRNFYNYFTDWFGSTQVPVNACAQPPSSQVKAADGEFTVDVAALNARAAPSTACEPVRLSLTAGTVVTRTAIWGDWWKVRYDRREYWVHSDYLEATPPVDYETSRISGIDRYETAVAVSQHAFPDGARTVLLASGADFPDALAAGAAAGHSEAALLLTRHTALPLTVSEELARLQPTRVVLVGGESRVSQQVAAAVQAAVPAAAVERIAGIDRYETSRLLAEEFLPDATSAYVVTGRNFPDAVVAAALGGINGSPVILVDGAASGVDDATVSALRDSGITNVTIAGSPAAVSTGVEGALTDAGLSVRRVGGIDRYQTAYLLNVDAHASGATTALFATGTGFADALTGSIIAAKSGAPLFTTPSTCMTGASKDWMIASGVASVLLIGGPPALSEAVAESVRC